VVAFGLRCSRAEDAYPARIFLGTRKAVPLRVRRLLFAKEPVVRLIGPGRAREVGRRRTSEWKRPL
jgi:hypothetical protein